MTQDSKHTPGPLKVIGNHVVSLTIREGVKPIVATVNQNALINHEEAEANGRLFAAAPTMAAEIERLTQQNAALREIVQRLASFKTTTSSGNTYRALWALQDDARAALKESETP